MKRKILSLYKTGIIEDFPYRDETRMTKKHTRVMKDESRYVRRITKNQLHILLQKGYSPKLFLEL